MGLRNSMEPRGHEVQVLSGARGLVWNQGVAREPNWGAPSGRGHRIGFDVNKR